MEAGAGTFDRFEGRFDFSGPIIEDGALPPGAYQLRARALDHARNETVADRTATGEPLAVTLPLRVVAAMQTAFERQRTIRETVRRGGRTRDIGRKVDRSDPGGARAVRLHRAGRWAARW